LPARQDGSIGAEGAAYQAVFIRPAPHGCEVACEISLKSSRNLSKSRSHGIESVINLLAPQEPDRFFGRAHRQGKNLASEAH